MEAKNQMTQEALNEVILQMKLDLPPEKIPGAVERLIADKHDKELQDLNLKHFEQKTMELRENMQTMMEEKVKRMQDARQDAATQKRGLQAIADKELDPSKKQTYLDKIEGVDKKLAKELQDIEDDITKQES
jgi:hypothetical protein